MAIGRWMPGTGCGYPVRRLTDYIRRYVPELANFDFDYIHEPWKAPIEAQQAANCIIGILYS